MMKKHELLQLAIVLFVFVHFTVAAHADRIRVQVSGRVDAYNKNGLVEEIDHPPVVTVEDYDPTIISIQTQTQVDQFYKWLIPGYLNRDMETSIKIDAHHPNFVNVNGPLVSEIKPDRRNFIIITLRTPGNAASNLFDKCNKILTQYSEIKNRTDKKETSHIEEVLNCFDRALNLDFRYEIGNAKADIYDCTGDWINCAEAFDHIAGKMQGSDKTRYWRALERKTYCLHRLAIKTQSRERWISVAQTAKEALSANPPLGRSRANLFRSWLDAIYNLSGSEGKDTSLVEAIFSNPEIKYMWNDLYFIHLKNIQIPTEYSKEETMKSLERLRDQLGGSP